MPSDNLVSIYDEFARTYASRRAVFDLTDVLEEFVDRLSRPVRDAAITDTDTAPGPTRSPALLDLGCGTGEPVMATFQQLGWEVTGVDFSPGMIRLAHNQLPEATLALSDMTEVEFTRNPSMPSPRCTACFTSPAANTRHCSPNAAAGCDPVDC